MQLQFLSSPLFFLLAVFGASAEDFYGGTDVVSLTDANFKTAIADNELVLVEFYAPWCGHCKSLKPIYSEAATKLKGKVMVAAVDATKEAVTASTYDAKSFPTISIFSQGNRVIKEYSGERTTEAIVAYMEGLIESKGVPPSSSSFGESEVVVLTDKNFDEVINGPDDVLVEFYAPWCGHCQELVPIYKEIAEQVKGTATLAAIDAVEFESIGDKYNVQGYPTLILFRDGQQVEEYQGERTKKAILDFLGGGKDLVITELNNEEELNKFLEHDVVVLAHFQKENDALEKVYKESQEQVMIQLDHIHYGIIKDPVLAKKLGWHFSPAAKLIRKADKFEIKYDFFGSPTTNKKLTTWAYANFLAPLSELTSDNSASLTGISIPQVLYLSGGPLDLSDDEKAKAVAVKNKYPNDVLLLWGDHSSGEEFLLDTMLTDLNVDPKKKYLVIITENKWWKQELDGKQSFDEVFADMVSKLVDKNQEFMDAGVKRVVPALSSVEGQSPDDVEQGGPVFNLIASIFQVTVMESAPDFFIEFYAPWCGHCKALQPIWDKLGEELKDTDVMVAKMDATANDIPHEFKVEGFPTLMYVKKVQGKDHEIIEYSGGRELSDLKDWVMKTHVPTEHNKKPAEGFSYYPPKKDGGEQLEDLMPIDDTEEQDDGSVDEAEDEGVVSETPADAKHTEL